MGIGSYPLNSKDPSSLRLVAASSLPATHPPAAKSEPVLTPKKILSDDATKLSDAALMEVSKLKARDAQLRQHEQAHHAASAGVDVSSASFTYQRGPNGVSYAVSGDVRIDTTAPLNPEDRLAQAAMISDVALAPADPTPTDRAVAAKAQQMAQQARMDIQQQVNNPGIKQAEQQSRDSNTPAAKKIDTYA